MTCTKVNKICHPRRKDENQQQTEPTCDVGSGNRTWATAVGGECSHRCAIPAPHYIAPHGYHGETLSLVFDILLEKVELTIFETILSCLEKIATSYL